MFLLGISDAAQDGQDVRLVHISWNTGLVTASIAISLLGAFTSTQLMCQAKVSRSITAITTWTMLASLTFGFCSIWSLHMVAMLACEVDLPIGLKPGLTVVSALLAVIFTFLAFSDLVWKRYNTSKHRRLRRVSDASQNSQQTSPNRESEEFLLSARHSFDEQATEVSPHRSVDPGLSKAVDSWGYQHPAARLLSDNSQDSTANQLFSSRYTEQTQHVPSESDHDEHEDLLQDVHARSSRSSSLTGSDSVFTGMGHFIGIRQHARSRMLHGNPFKATAVAVWTGLTCRNVGKGFVWSLAITCMHYLGIYSLEIPGGLVQLRPLLVMLSALISWVVCCVGCILLPSIEVNMGQQLLFSAVATSGVAAMHYTGMAALRLYSTTPPSERHGYPPGLSIAIASIAIVTCLAANGLLAHSATLARNKLAEIVRTRRKLWAAIAQKENAEAAAMARSEFIASASHEIRTPLHQLQGYADLKARCPLPEDAKLLLFAIQDATKTLSLITNNVLDWSRLEKGEATTKPSKLDVRKVCDSVIKLLPRRDEDSEVEFIAVVAPSLCKEIIVDETYLSRIMMNLVSNALKFTASGYVFLHLEQQNKAVVITVKDTGIGIPDSFLPHLFEPFKQAQTRGAAHGTGLGLSIIKQLLEKVQGSIVTHSSYQDAEGVGPAASGSEFIVTMPLDQIDEMDVAEVSPCRSQPRKKLAYLGSPSRTTDCLTQAWNEFNVEMICAQGVADITDSFDYLWVDDRVLEGNQTLLKYLLTRSDSMVLLPYDEEEKLDEILDLRRPAHIIPLKRPLVFHQILRAIDNVTRADSKPDVANRTVRFASEPEILAEQPTTETDPASLSSTQTLSTEPSSLESFGPVLPTVMLVEDNKINQKLGAKMLKALKYNVILADDGQEAIDILHDPDNAAIIDIILMDQSMPRKDGLTATKEIRELETSGAIVPARRWQEDPVRRHRRPILAVTAVVSNNHEEMCKAVGTDAFLPKPLSLSKLKDNLAAYDKKPEPGSDLISL